MNLLPRRLRRQEGERGYVAVLTALLLTLLMGVSAFAVDVGNWYYVGQRAQRAADAAALSGVTSLPGSPSNAYLTAGAFSKTNGFENAKDATTVTSSVVTGRPTRLRVTVTRTVDNIFGPLLGVPKTTITRTAVADYAGPVPMGSPCNEYGDDPEDDGRRSSNCDATGAYWANVGSLNATKGSGDAYQNGVCGGDDNCAGGTNSDYDPNGYVYTVTITKPINGLTIQAFDPAMIVVGDTCTSSNLDGASLLTNTRVSNPGVRYAKNAGAWCTGDQPINPNDGLGDIKTQFNVFSPGSNPWDPLNWPKVATKEFTGFNGKLTDRLDKNKPATYNQDGVADNFRRLGQPVQGRQAPSRRARMPSRSRPTDSAPTGRAGTTGSPCVPSATPAATRTTSRSPVSPRWRCTATPPTARRSSTWPRCRAVRTGSSSTSAFSTSATVRRSAAPSRCCPPSETGGTFTGCKGSGP